MWKIHKGTTVEPFLVDQVEVSQSVLIMIFTHNNPARQRGATLHERDGEQFPRASALACLLSEIRLRFVTGVRNDRDSRLLQANKPVGFRAIAIYMVLHGGMGLGRSRAALIMRHNHNQTTRTTTSNISKHNKPTYFAEIVVLDFMYPLAMARVKVNSKLFLSKPGDLRPHQS